MGARVPTRGHFIFNKDSVFLPFLYRTRTLTVPYSQSPNFRPAYRCSNYEQSCRYSTRSTAKGPEETSPLHDGDPSYAEDDAPPRRSYLSSVRARKAKSSEPEPAKRGDGNYRRSTVTPTERKLFQRLLKTSGPSGSPRLTRIVQTVSRKKIVRPASRSPGTFKPFMYQTERGEVDDISDIMGSSLYKLQKQRQQRALETSDEDDDDSLGPLPQFKEPNNRRYGYEMTRLGRVYAKLKRFQKSDIDSPSESGATAGMDLFPIAYLTAQREADKICNEMDDAVAAGKGDLGVWKICENRVFRMLDLVTLNQGDPSSMVSDEGKDSTSSLLGSADESKVENVTRSPAEAAVLAEIGLEIPPEVPILDVVRQVYPRVLLHAMRIFHTNFPVSHFATQLPETAKSHSRFSRMVGASSDFYNELMAFVWGFYSDISQVIMFLREMEVTGVPFDGTTLRIVEDIQTQRELAKNGAEVDKGEGKYVGNSWWWDTPATVKAYRELVEGNEKNPDWITKIRTQIRKDLTARRRRSKYTKRYFKEQLSL